MAGNLVMVNKDGICIPKGTIVRVVAVDSGDKLPEKGLVGSARCVAVNDRSLSGGIWCAYLAPIPLSVEILEKNGFKQVQKNYWVWERKVRTNTDIMYCDEIVGFGKEFPSKENGGLHTGGWIHASSARGLVDMEGENVHQLQQFLTLCGIEKEITLDGISAKEG